MLGVGNVEWNRMEGELGVWWMNGLREWPNDVASFLQAVREWGGQIGGAKFPE